MKIHEISNKLESNLIPLGVMAIAFLLSSVFILIFSYYELNINKHLTCVETLFTGCVFIFFVCSSLFLLSIKVSKAKGKMNEHIEFICRHDFEIVCWISFIFMAIVLLWSSSSLQLIPSIEY
jgi:hypothetical protein